VRLPAQASASAAGTSEASTKREALNVTRQLEMNTKTLAALQRASKQATTAKTAAQAKANNLQVKIDASIQLRGASGPQQLNTLETKAGAQKQELDKA
jgi:hypothetical protein